MIRTPRLLLRRARETDLEALFAVLSDAEAMRFWSEPPHPNRERTAQWLKGMISAPPELSDDFVIELQGEVVDKVGFWRLPEIGFILRRDQWRKGLLFEAASAVIGHVEETRGLREFTADVDPRNVASLKLLQKLGFVETHRAEKTFCVAGEWVDSVYLARRR